MLSAKFKTCLVTSFKKNKDISFLMGSNDLISIDFFIQTSKNFYKDKKQCYGLNRPINNTYNVSLLMTSSINTSNEIQLKCENIWNLDYGTLIVPKPLFAGGIIGFSNSLFNYTNFFNIINDSNKYNIYNEIELERYSIDNGAELAYVNNCFFLNIKTFNDITQIREIIANNNANMISHNDLDKKIILKDNLNSVISLYNEI